MSRIYTSRDGGSYANAISERNGANVEGHVYSIVSGTDMQELRFQLGPVKEAGINGCQNEQILSVIVHRLGVLNKAFPCRENAIAIAHIETALLWLEKRTADRLARGVEGHNKP